MVVIAIMTILTSILLIRHRQFDSSTLLRSLAYKIALSIREAQVYGTSARQFGSGATSSFTSNYGIYFSSGNYYYLFAEGVNGDKCRAGATACSSNPGTEDVQRYSIGTGYTLKTFCGMNSTVMNCSSACPLTLPSGIVTCVPNVITWLTVYFRRPNPDAQFYTSSGPGPYSAAYVQLWGPTKGATDTRGITVTSTGQISVGEQGT
jgi:hypothetical protein